MYNQFSIVFLFRPPFISFRHVLPTNISKSRLILYVLLCKTYKKCRFEMFIGLNRNKNLNKNNICGGFRTSGLAPLFTNILVYNSSFNILKLSSLPFELCDLCDLCESSEPDLDRVYSSFALASNIFSLIIS